MDIITVISIIIIIRRYYDTSQIIYMIGLIGNCLLTYDFIDPITK